MEYQAVSEACIPSVHRTCHPGRYARQTVQAGRIANEQDTCAANPYKKRNGCAGRRRRERIDEYIKGNLEGCSTGSQQDAVEKQMVGEIVEQRLAEVIRVSEAILLL